MAVQECRRCEPEMALSPSRLNDRSFQAIACYACATVYGATVNRFRNTELALGRTMSIYRVDRHWQKSGLYVSSKLTRHYYIYPVDCDHSRLNA